MIHDLFRVLIALHIATGATGALTFWIPVIGRKGGAIHRAWGKIFTRVLLATGSFATAMSLLTLIDPYTTHPHLVGQFDADFIRGIFGHMMLFLGILTINLTWYGWQCVTYKQNRAAMREWRNVLLQPLLLMAATNCAIEGWLINQILMLAISLVGYATALTNLWFLFKPKAAPKDWLKEHLKALVGSGISVYTAFMAFGSIRILPTLALNPIMWAIPLSTGVSIIVWHWWKIDGGYRYYAGLLRGLIRHPS
jgi:hypothetical protein